jgi:putative proteasome-type protease
MTYCVGVLLNDGVVFASDSRTNAGVDNFASFCKMTVFERPGDRVVVLLSSGNLAGTQAVISMLKQRGDTKDSDKTNIWTAKTMFDVAVTVSDAVRAIERRDGEHLAGSATPFNASFIIGGQIKGESLRLFRTFAEGNFIEAGTDTPFFQTGEAKYGKPIIDRVMRRSSSLNEAAKCALVSMDSTIRSNLSVGLPLDLVLIKRDRYEIARHISIDADNEYFRGIRNRWSEALREAFAELPDPDWPRTPTA